MFFKKFYIYKSYYENFGKEYYVDLIRETWRTGVHHAAVLSFQGRYLLNNWVYSTNHKRISINYFWFILLAGVVGMVLATIIRIEMAYPGVGILAGDNGQYLSIVTAHGVIMVFFMAMPMLFGFFTNFLLPTQLGVHDVAFPRMNSAAFWFLPASLILLAQLVCVDRRYQRMNCFSLRELQSLVRNQFFTELQSQIDFNKNSSKYLHELRNKLSAVNLDNSEGSMSATLFFHKNNQFKNFTADWFNNTNSNNTVYGNFIKQGSIPRFSYDAFSRLWNLFISVLCSLISFLRNLVKLDASNITNSLFTSLTNSININPTGFYFVVGSLSTNSFFRNLTFSNSVFFTNFNDFSNFVNTEVLDTKRYTSFNDPKITYKVKIGNFLPEKPYLYNYNHLYNSLLYKTVTDKSKQWFYCDIAKLSMFTSFNVSFRFDLYIDGAEDNVSKYIQNWDIFFLFSGNFLGNFVNPRFVSLSELNNKFSSIFFNQNQQQLVLNNWRHLKLQREGWRCRMLLAKNQLSMYRRHVSLRNTTLMVEKNAKDLLPGWAMITPFSSRTRYTLVGKTDIGILVVAITLFASLISCANFLITYRYLSTLNNRKMRDARSFFAEAIIVTCCMTLLANPMLILGLLMLMSDRHWKTSFFDYSGGGDTVLFQHMFWFFGHPEVYIIIVPCFGFVNTMLSFYLRKRISARASLMYSMYTIAFLGFFVWGHHMYMVGLSHTTRMLYSTLTVMISVPAATKIMHWLVTFINSSVHFEIPFLYTVVFIFFFLSGGISGMAVAHTGMDILFHDTFYVIGHFHVMLAGSLMLAGFGAFYFYLPAIFGVRYNRFYAYSHFIYYVIGQLFTVIPMIWLGYAGMPRRVLDYPGALGGWHSIATSAHILSVAGVLCFILMIFESMKRKRGYAIKSFGVGRYNTRLNFYLYEASRNKYRLYKSNFFNYHRFDMKSSRYLFSEDYLVTYVLTKK